MPLSDAVPNQFEEWMDQYEAGARQGVHERFDLTDRAGNEKKWNAALLPADVKPSEALAPVGNVCSVDPEQLYSEDRLGCARGMVWALGFQAALLIAIGAYWTLRFLLR
jgi:hypothetical protein